MKLYHGSNQIIKTPYLNKSKKYLDFGSGFYLSVALKQAENRGILNLNELWNTECINSDCSISEYNNAIENIERK